MPPILCPPPDRPPTQRGSAPNPRLGPTTPLPPDRVPRPPAAPASPAPHPRPRSPPPTGPARGPRRGAEPATPGRPASHGAGPLRPTDPKRPPALRVSSAPCPPSPLPYRWGQSPAGTNQGHTARTMRPRLHILVRIFGTHARHGRHPGWHAVRQAPPVPAWAGGGWRPCAPDPDVHTGAPHGHRHTTMPAIYTPQMRTKYTRAKGRRHGSVPNARWKKTNLGPSRKVGRGPRPGLPAPQRGGGEHPLPRAHGPPFGRPPPHGTDRAHSAFSPGPAHRLVPRLEGARGTNRRPEPQRRTGTQGHHTIPRASSTAHGHIYHGTASALFGDTPWPNSTPPSAKPARRR